MKTLSEILWGYGMDIFDSEGAVDEINVIIEQESEKRADEKTEVKFKERMQEEELRRKKENEKNIVRSLAINTYKKHYLKDEISINGELITAINYFAKNAKQIPGYVNQKLVYNECIGSWEIHNKNGNRNIVSDFHAIFVVIVMKSSECEAVVVQLNSSGNTRSYTYDYDDFMSRRILKSMPLESRNPGVSNELFVESFYSSIKLCSNVQFFTVPEKSGWILTEGKNIDFVSSDSVCPELEKFYSSDIKERVLVPTDCTFEEIIKEYSGLTMKNQEIVFKIIIRVMSLLLPFFEGEGLKPDRIFVIESKDDKNAQEIISLVKTKNYDSTTVPSLTEYVTNIRSELQSINDGTVVFRDSELIEKNRERKNALEENYKELLQCNGIENVSRKVVIIVTDIPGCIPEDYPAYYLSATDSMNIDDIRNVQKLSGEFDYSLIKFIIENTDVAGNLIQNATKKAKQIENDFHETPVTKNNWSGFLDTKNPIVVISTGYDSVGKGTQAIDMLLENLYAFKQRYPDKRYTVIIDEVQDQYLSEKGPINILLRKGGKHNLSMLLASQEFPDENTALGKVVGNCGTVKIFRPKQDNLKRVSQFTGVD